MLAFFRRRKWIWVVLIAVFSVALVVTLIPAQLGTGGLAWGDVARVGGQDITAAEFQESFHAYVDQMGSGLTLDVLLQLGLDAQVVESLIDQYVMIAEAERYGLDATPGEVEAAILGIPELQENGVFIGLDRYRELLAANGLTVADFERGIRDDVRVQKLYALLTDPMTVSLEDAESEYRYANEQVAIDYFVVDGPALESRVETTEEEQRAYYEENSARYTVPEMRRAEYVFVDTIRIRAEAEVTEDEILAYYNERIDDYRIQPRVAAQHVLFRTQGRSPEEIAEIRNRAAEVAERARSGEDFAELAREYSEDTGSAPFGGELPAFGPGEMVPAFERAAFELDSGAVSDPVETDFGIHVIRVNDNQRERVQSVDEVRIGVESIIRFEKGADIAAAQAQAVAVALVGNPDVAAVAEEYGADVRETDLLARGDVYNGLSDTAALENQIFSLEVDEVGRSVEVANGHVIPILREVQETRPATYEEAVDDVSEDLRVQLADDLATAARGDVERLVADGASLEEAAAAVGLDVVASGPLAREGSLPEFGSTAELDNTLFSIAAGTTAAPVTVAGRTIVFAVRERPPLDEEAMRQSLPDLQTQLLADKKLGFVAAYAIDVKARMERDGDIWKADPGRLADVAEMALIGHAH